MNGNPISWLRAWPANPIWQLYSRYGPASTPYAILGITATLLGRFLGLIPAFIIGLAVDAIFFAQRTYTFPVIPSSWIPTSPTGQLWFSIGILLTATLLGAPVSWFEDWGWSVFAQRVQHALRVDAYATLQRLDMRYFTGQRTGELMSILNNDVNALETFLEDALSSVFWITATFIGIGAILITLNPPLTAITLLPIPFLALFTLIFTKIIEPRYLDVRSEIGDLNARLQNNISGIEVIKTEHAEPHEAQRVADASASYLAANLDAVRIQITYFPGLTVISGLGFALTFLIGGLWVLTGPPLGLTGTLTPGAFVTFVIYAQQYIWPIIQFGSVVDSYERAKASATRITALMGESSYDHDDPNATDLVVTNGTVTYDNVTFGYRDTPVIQDVSFTVTSGQTIGIVGPTGAGKTTLLKLLPRLYLPDSGTITIDDQPLDEVTLESLRRSIGYVSQEPFLFYGTIRDNIQYGSFTATDQDIKTAAKKAHAHDFIVNLPAGYDTLVGERGVKLSGGQRQRVAIARTILKNPAFLVLDEATSHVDTETEALIQRSFADFTADRTTFIIAHRLSTVKNADQIIVLDDGQIVERGTHTQLLKTDGLYANLWRVQAGDIDSLPAAFLERARQRQSQLPRDDDS